MTTPRLAPVAAAALLGSVALAGCGVLQQAPTRSAPSSSRPAPPSASPKPSASSAKPSASSAKPSTSTKSSGSPSPSKPASSASGVGALKVGDCITVRGTGSTVEARTVECKQQGTTTYYVVSKLGKASSDCPTNYSIYSYGSGNVACLRPVLVENVCYSNTSGMMDQVDCGAPNAILRYLKSFPGTDPSVCAAGQTPFVFAEPAPGVVYCAVPAK